MSGVTIGRVPVDCPFSPVEIGDTWSFSFELFDLYSPVSVDEVQWRMSALRGLAVGETIPVVWDDDPRLSGYYRLAAPVSLDPDPAYLTTGYVVGDITLTRVSRNFANPIIETVVTESERDTAKYAITALARVWLSDDVTSRTSDSLAVISSRSTETGAVSAYQRPASSASLAVVDPSKFYNAAALIEARHADGTWRPVVGSHLPQGTTASDVRLSNGRLRWRWTTDGELFVATWGGATWGAEAKIVDDAEWPTSTTWTPRDVRVVRNSNAGVAVEYRQTSTASVASMTMALNRGELFVTLGAPSAITSAWTMTENHTAVTGGSSGSLYVFGSTTNTTASTTDVAVTIANRAVMLGVIGSTGEAAADLFDYWWAGVSVRDLVRS